MSLWKQGVPRVLGSVRGGRETKGGRAIAAACQQASAGYPCGGGCQGLGTNVQESPPPSAERRGEDGASDVNVCVCVCVCRFGFGGGDDLPFQHDIDVLMMRVGACPCVHCAHVLMYAHTPCANHSGDNCTLLFVCVCVLSLFISFCFCVCFSFSVWSGSLSDPTQRRQDQLRAERAARARTRRLSLTAATLPGDHTKEIKNGSWCLVSELARAEVRALRVFLPRNARTGAKFLERLRLLRSRPSRRRRLKARRAHRLEQQQRGRRLWAEAGVSLGSAAGHVSE